LAGAQSSRDREIGWYSWRFFDYRANAKRGRWDIENKPRGAAGNFSAIRRAEDPQGRRLSIIQHQPPFEVTPPPRPASGELCVARVDA
jgi:hypothetical protein